MNCFWLIIYFSVFKRLCKYIGQFPEQHTYNVFEFFRFLNVFSLNSYSIFTTDTRLNLHSMNRKNSAVKLYIVLVSIYVTASIKIFSKSQSSIFANLKKSALLIWRPYIRVQWFSTFFDFTIWPPFMNEINLFWDH